VQKPGCLSDADSEPQQSSVPVVSSEVETSSLIRNHLVSVKWRNLSISFKEGESFSLAYSIIVAYYVRY